MIDFTHSKCEREQDEKERRQKRKERTKSHEVLEQPKVEKSRKVDGWREGERQGGREGGKGHGSPAIQKKPCQRELTPGLVATLQSTLFIPSK